LSQDPGPFVVHVPAQLTAQAPHVPVVVTVKPDAQDGHLPGGEHATAQFGSQGVGWLLLNGMTDAKTQRANKNPPSKFFVRVYDMISAISSGRECRQQCETERTFLNL